MRHNWGTAEAGAPTRQGKLHVTDSRIAGKATDNCSDYPIRRQKVRQRTFEGRPTIGYLTPRIGDSTSRALWSGVADAAQRQDVNLICFAGEILHDLECPHARGNVLYDLVHAEIVDGLVSWASGVGGDLNRDAIVNFHRRYRPLPMVSITLPLEGGPTVLVDSYQGIRDAIAHLVEVHG